MTKKQKTGTVIRGLRTAAGISQSDLGSRIGFNPRFAQSQISRIESGRDGISIETAAKIAEIFSEKTSKILGIE